ncbi:MAG: PD-(D/E)XK nuclease family protein [Gammaproteobacteria bacterium]|nr:PD-(D/E)XK nuclease family protein [Gammaproteobacteria bacterium]
MENIQHVTQDNFNEFIVSNYKDVQVILSIRERLINYGQNVVTDGIAQVMPKKNIANRSVISMPEEGPIDNRNIMQSKAAEHGLYYLLLIPKVGLICVELDFDLYKLHWGVCIYSAPSVENSVKDRVSKKDKSSEAMGKDELVQYATKCGVVNDADAYQLEQKAANAKDSVLSIASILPTGNRENDKKAIVKSLEEIISKLLGNKDNKPFANRLDLVAEIKDYGWEQLVSDYKSKHLLKPPTKVPTFLEIAGIAHKENNISNVLQFLIDENKPHPFGNIFYRAFYALAMGKKDDKDGKVECVHREYSTAQNKRIDLLIETDRSVVVIENKIYASLYNNLEEYKETGESLAEGDKDDENSVDKELVCIVLAPFGLSPADAGKAKSNGFVAITYDELFKKVMSYMSEVNVYHENKHFLYMQLFYDLFRTIENLTEWQKQIDDFQLFVGEGNRGYWAGQIVHNFVYFRNGILAEVEKRLREKLTINGKLWSYYDENEVRAAKKRAGKVYAEARHENMLGKALVFDSKFHKIDKGKSKLTIDTYFDTVTQKWHLHLWFRDANYKQKNLGKIHAYLKKHNGAILQNDKAYTLENNFRYRIELNEQGTREATVNYIFDMLQDTLIKIGSATAK